jgi:ABC-type hemin transport system substrate-binding protein
VTTPPRIACLVPSVTELLAALGLGPALVARTGFCVHPAAVVASIPKVGGTKDVNIDKLRKLAPTHVVVNVDENTLPMVQAVKGFVPNVIVTHPCAPHEVLDLIDQLAAAFAAVPGVTEKSRALKDELRTTIDEVQSVALPAVPVLYLIWREPWMTVARDTYISRMLAVVNWHTWPDVDGGQAGAARYPAVRGDETGLAEVRQVLLSSEPYSFAPSHVASAQALCPNAHVQLVDGELLSWYGPRTARGLRYALALARQAIA